MLFRRQKFANYAKRIKKGYWLQLFVGMLHAKNAGKNGFKKNMFAGTVEPF